MYDYKYKCSTVSYYVDSGRRKFKRFFTQGEKTLGINV